MILRLASEHTLEFLAFTGLLAMIICISKTFLALVGNVRATIQDKESLTVAGKQLENDRALPEYNAHQEHTISLVLDLREGMQTLAKTFSLHVIHQCLVSVSKQLETDRNLSEYDVQKDNPLHLMLYLRGAGLQIYVRTLVLHLGNTLDTDLTQLCLRGGMQIFAKTLTAIYLESIFQLVPRLRGGMHIYALEGKTTTLDVETSDVSGNIQARIPNKKGIITISQRLILVSKQFKDDHSTARHRIQKEYIFHFVLSLCGNMPISEEILTGKTIPLDVNFNPSIPP